VVGDRARGHERAEHDGEREQGHAERTALGARPAHTAGREVGQQDEHQHGEQERPGLQEREVRPVEVEADVGGGERAGEEDRQEGPDADRGGQPGALEEVEEVVHAR